MVGKMLKLITIFINLILTILLWGTPALAQSAGVTLLKQEKNGLQPQMMNTEELASLGDPLFNLVLKEHADITNLTEIEALIKGEESTFVVDEKIADATPNRDNTRRAILAFSGTNGNEELKPNVMFSVSFDSEEFPDTQPIEAWGWDSKRARYNYYKLDQAGTPNQLSWKFRGSSDQADLLALNERKGTCMECHINGAPIMKELLFPWDSTLR